MIVKEHTFIDVLTSDFGGFFGTDNACVVCLIIHMFVTSLLTTLLEKKRLYPKTSCNSDTAFQKEQCIRDLLEAQLADSPIELDCKPHSVNVMSV